MIATMNLKFEHMIFRIDKLGNGDKASINRNRTNNKLHGTNSFQTRFSKLSFPNFEGGNPTGWI